jgi:hypothetical protein
MNARWMLCSMLLGVPALGQMVPPPTESPDEWVRQLVAVNAPEQAEPDIPANPRGCGTFISPAEVEKLLANQLAGMYELPAGGGDYGTRYALTVRTRLTRCMGATILTQADLDQSMAALNAYFAPMGVQFKETEPRRDIPGPQYYNLTSSADFDTLVTGGDTPNVMDVFFVNSMNFGSDLCGRATFTTSTGAGVVMVNSCTPAKGNPSVFMHEVGHYFDLYHTHETAFGVACPNGIACGSLGDQVCDTPADPDLTGRTDGNCNITGLPGLPNFCLFPPTAYNPNPRNLMSYSDQSCAINMTQGQRDRFMATLQNARANHLLSGYDYNSTWLDFGYAFLGSGTFNDPYKDMGSAINGVPVGGTIAIKSSTNTWTGRITKPMRLDSWRGQSVIGR